MKVVWTLEAVETFETTIENINSYWTQKEITKFIEQTEHTIELIRKNPYMYVATKRIKKLEKAL